MCSCATKVATATTGKIQAGGASRPRPNPASARPESVSRRRTWGAWARYSWNGSVGVEVIQLNYHQYVVAARFDAATFAIYAIGCLQIPL